MKGLIISFTIMAVVFAIALTVLAYLFIIPEKKAKALNKFGKFLHDFLNFKVFFLEKMMQALYIFSTAFVALYGFFMLFMVTEDYFGDTQWMGGQGLLYMILGPIVIRISYELTMMLITLTKSAVEINKNIKKLPTSQENPSNDAPASPLFNVHKD